MDAAIPVKRAMLIGDDALQGDRQKQSGAAADLHKVFPQADATQKPRAISLRWYFVGALIYNCTITVALCAASWAFLSLMLTK